MRRGQCAERQRDAAALPRRVPTARGRSGSQLEGIGRANVNAPRTSCCASVPHWHLQKEGAEWASPGDQWQVLLGLHQRVHAPLPQHRSTYICNSCKSVTL